MKYLFYLTSDNYSNFQYVLTFHLKKKQTRSIQTFLQFRSCKKKYKFYISDPSQSKNIDRRFIIYKKIKYITPDQTIVWVWPRTITIIHEKKVSFSFFFLFCRGEVPHRHKLQVWQLNCDANNFLGLHFEVFTIILLHSI